MEALWATILFSGFALEVIIRPQKKDFTNNEKSFIIAVLLKGTKVINSCNLMPGAAAIIEPGDKIDLDGCEWMFVRVL